MTSDLARTLSSPDFNFLAKTLNSCLPFSAQLANYQPLAGDASNRRYYRLTLQQSEYPSLILMQLADAEGFKASEEAVSGGEADNAELPFLNVLRHLRAVEIPVPTLHYYDEQVGLLYLEDFGDVTLAEACSTADPIKIEHLYAQAIDLLVQIHLRATSPKDPSSCLAFGRRFDVPLLMWEFEHFLEYGVVARLGKPMCSDDYLVVRDEFQKIAEAMVTQPQVFTHRDYHSRNLMVDGDRLGVIDFQDALLGPATYDLASLLRDSYIALNEQMIDQMIHRYIQGMCTGLDQKVQQSMLLTDPDSFRRLFDFTSMQRNLKAAGRFVYIDRVKQNPKFLADIPRTLEYVRRNLEKYPEMTVLLTHLAPYVPEWH